LITILHLFPRSKTQWKSDQPSATRPSAARHANPKSNGEFLF
jgi:hypothetical protein